MSETQLKVMVLAGGPDRERAVSLASGQQVAAALKNTSADSSGAHAASGVESDSAPWLGNAKHDVRLRDVGPHDLSALDEFEAWRGERGPTEAGRHAGGEHGEVEAGAVVFPALHGPWGEGGGLQRILDDRGLPYVGCRAGSAALCMDKRRTKEVLARHGLPTPPFEVVTPTTPLTLAGPVVLKPLAEGSSLGVVICENHADAASRKVALAKQFGPLLAERFIPGSEITVGVLGKNPPAATDDHQADAQRHPDVDADSNGDADGDGDDDGGDVDADAVPSHVTSGNDVIALPPLQIMPGVEFYDYDAKYSRDDTRYRFDIDLPDALLDDLRQLARQAHTVLGCRHLSRVDFIVDADHRPWILEVNTMPGFTSHSLLPKAADYAGISFAALCARLVRLGAQR